MADGLAVSPMFLEEAEARAAAQALAGGELVVAEARAEEIEEPAPLPYTTAELLADAAERWTWPAVKVMAVAQRLFEGVTLNGAHTGLITYPRTDSAQTAAEARAEARALIAQLYGPAALPAAGVAGWLNVFRRSSGAGAAPAVKSQEAHEAIRPTATRRKPDDLRAVLDEDELALYRRIWERFVASQMRPARYRLTTVELESSD